MQTFLPYPNFAVSAMVLDTQRLGKQRIEARQILGTLRGESGSGWTSHPAVRMWDGHLLALMLYGDCVIREWVRRGYQSSMPLMLTQYDDSRVGPIEQIVMPSWLGRPDLHASHRSNLLRKKPDWYGRLGWSEPPDQPYVWPS